MSSTSEPSGPAGRRLPWRAIVVAVVVVLVALLPLARHLLDRRDELLAANTRSAVSPTAETVRPGARSCTDVRRDDLLTIPRGTTAVRLFAAYTNRLAPRLEVVLTGAAPPCAARGRRRTRRGSRCCCRWTVPCRPGSPGSASATRAPRR